MWRPLYPPTYILGEHINIEARSYNQNKRISDLWYVLYFSWGYKYSFIIPLVLSYYDKESASINNLTQLSPAVPLEESDSGPWVPEVGKN